MNDMGHIGLKFIAVFSMFLCMCQNFPFEWPASFSVLASGDNNLALFHLKKMETVVK